MSVPGELTATGRSQGDAGCHRNGREGENQDTGDVGDAVCKVLGCSLDDDIVGSSPDASLAKVEIEDKIV